MTWRLTEISLTSKKKIVSSQRVFVPQTSAVHRHEKTQRMATVDMQTGLASKEADENIEIRKSDVVGVKILSFVSKLFL